MNPQKVHKSWLTPKIRYKTMRTNAAKRSITNSINRLHRELDKNPVGQKTVGQVLTRAKLERIRKHGSLSQYSDADFQTILLEAEGLEGKV